MTVELIILGISGCALVLLYTARWYRTDQTSFLFSQGFLQKADTHLFEFIKFAFRLSTLVSHNIHSFIRSMPNALAHGVHQASHSVSVWTKTWIDGVTHREADKEPGQDFTNSK